MIDVSALLQPIRPDQPSGIDLRTSTRDDVFLAVRELRRRDDPALMPEGVPPKEPDFRNVVERCRKALSADSKDLELAAYLAEGWTALEGFDGLAAGLELMAGLVESFWADIWPGVEHEGDRIEIIEPIRAKWVGWLGNSREFLDTVRGVPLTSGGSELTLLDYEDALRMADAQRTNVVQFEEMRKAGRTSPEQWAVALAATPAAEIETIVASVARCIAAVDRLESLANERLGDEAPTFRGLREMFDKLGSIRAEVPAAPSGGEDPATSAATAPATAGGGGAPGALRTRPDAVAALQQVARFLRTAEPHSPVSFLVERCVRWLNMSFEEVMQDLVENHDTMSLVRKTLGIQEPPQE